MSQDKAAPRGDTVTVSGVLPKLKPEDARRIGVFLVRGKEVLAHSALDDKGTFRIPVYRQTLEMKSAYPVEAVVGPLAMGKNFDSARKLPIMAVDASKIDARKELVLSAANLDLSDEILRPWWIWCRNYCVSGTVVGPNGCPVPGAQVTVSSVLHAANNGFTVTPQATVTADNNGNFTACFEWCSFCYGWPCWPIWWDCWPWWWEWDILRVLREVEARLAVQPVAAPAHAAAISKLQPRIALPLKQPAAAELMIGQGFTEAARIKERIAPDPARTAQIKAKFADPRIRALFPWWWWCCENPNILFTVTQGANTIVAENPTTDTRWCFAAGNKVTLVGSKETIATCGSDPRPAHGFVWTRVGNTLVSDISGGYANGSGNGSDMAFAGALDIYGEFAFASPASYYQVLAGDWSGDPSRGGTSPSSPGAPIGLDLYNYAFMLHGGGTVTVEAVKMGPFSANGLSNLYATEEARAAVPSTLLPAFPAGSFIAWAYSGRKVYADASTLAGGSVAGIELSVKAYDSAFSPLSLPPNTDDALTLEIDSNGLTTTHINSFKAYDTHGNEITSTSGDDNCPSFTIPAGGYVVLNTTVTDDNGHLCYYEMVPNYGHSQTGTATTPDVRGYKTATPFSPHPVPGPYAEPDVAHKAFVGGTENITYYPTTDCCYSFNLNVQKRCTDGYSIQPSYTADFWTATIKMS
ncbi:MAG TPA: carboxypeptidase-like regulatory domain-containing protein [Burkholderiaceae bacterium]